jgi:diguanylate cyclase (GGDEF)-like protein
MKDNTRTLITLGFMVVLGLMFSLTAVSLAELHKVNESMETLVEVTNKKTAAANEMRDAIRLRADGLKNMQLTDDFFVRDDEHQRMIHNAGKFRIAREQLANLGMNEKEEEINSQLLQLIRVAQPFLDNASDMLMSHTPIEGTAPAIENAKALQKVILDKLDQLVELERQNTEQALSISRNHYIDTRKLLFTLTGIALLFSLLVARVVIKLVSSKNRQLTYQASHDALTGLINRREFESRVERAIQQTRSQGSTHALMYLDLDQFKVVNDTCGHAAGDELLQQLAQLLLSSVRHRDTLSRLGGDEFGMLLENCPLDSAVSIANTLLKSVDAFHYNWSGNIFTLGISIGVVPLDQGTQDIASAMSAADSACYIAKESGRNQVQIAHLGDRRLQQRQGEMKWVSRLTRALEENRFALYYQPIVPCADRHARGNFLEILLRMIDDDGSIISPRTFLPAAEKYNLATAIDRWVIEHAMQWLAENSSGEKWPVTISINLSGQSMGNQDMLKYIINKMDETDISAEQIIFEVTETAAIENIAAATSFMLTLRGCGFRFSLDDFGSGLSSFCYLKKLPVEFLKIDGTFIRDILSDPVDYAMVRSITELGQLLGKQTIAEYVETMQVAEELRNIGVDFMQGHAYARAEPLDTFTHRTKPQLVLVSS